MTISRYRGTHSFREEPKYFHQISILLSRCHVVLPSDQSGASFQPKCCEQKNAFNHPNLLILTCADTGHKYLSSVWAYGWLTKCNRQFIMCRNWFLSEQMLDWDYPAPPLEPVRCNRGHRSALTLNCSPLGLQQQPLMVGPLHLLQGVHF